MDKAQLIEKHRYWNVECDEWWDCTYDSFKERMKEQGILVTDIYFSGFCSQGDGACFEGFIKDTALFIKKNFTPEKFDFTYPIIRKLLSYGGEVRVSCKHRGHYYHKNSVQFDVDHDLFEYILPITTEFHAQVVETMDAALLDELRDFEHDAQEIFKNHMCDLYLELEREYDYLTSDEAVWEAIEANKLNEGE